MSKEQVSEFFKKVTADDALKAKAKTIDLQNAPAVTNFAKEQGFDFSEADLTQWQEEQESELSDDDLENVSGGAVTVAGALAATAIATSTTAGNGW